MTGSPGSDAVGARYAGDSETLASAATSSLTVVRRPSELVISVPTMARSDEESGVSATLTTGGRLLAEKSVVLVVEDEGGATVRSLVAITDLRGTVRLGDAPPPGRYRVLASFGDPTFTVDGVRVGTADPETAPASATAVLEVAGVPTAIAVVSGAGQSAVVGTAFAAPLVVLVTDGLGRPVRTRRSASPPRRPARRRSPARRSSAPVRTGWPR